MKKNRKIWRDAVVASVLYSLSSIVGPLLFLGSIGWILDRIFNTRPFILLASVFVAFIVANILLFKKVKKLSQEIDAFGNKIKDEVQNGINNENLGKNQEEVDL